MVPVPSLDRLTDKFVRSVRADSGRIDYWDTSRPGLLLRVMAAGTKAFVFSYREPGARPAQERRKRSLLLGHYDPEGPKPYTLADAVRDWRTASGQVADGVDPKGPSPRGRDGAGEQIVPVSAGIPDALRGKTVALFGGAPLLVGSFGELARDYLVLHAWVTKRRTRDDEQMLARDLLPEWRNRSAASITSEDVATLTSNIVRLRNAPVAANHVRLLISRIYAFGMTQVRVRHNPAYGVRVTGGKPKAGGRWLSDEEIVKLWKGVEESWSPASKSSTNASRLLAHGDVFRALTRCRIVLFQRPGEVACMEWSEIQPDGWWLIPGTKHVRSGGRLVEVGTKNKLNHAVFLPPLAIAEIERLRAITGEGRFVFASPKRPDQPMLATAKTLNGLIARLGMKRFTPHDHRRTGVTNLQRMGCDDTVIDRVVNHQPAGVRRSYNLWAFREERRRAMLAWNAHLTSILGI